MVCRRVCSFCTIQLVRPRALRLVPRRYCRHSALWGIVDSFHLEEAPAELFETREFGLAMYVGLCRVSAYARTLNSAYLNMLIVKDIWVKKKSKLLGD